jgi:nucleoside-diphosphate-sugar epimerase
VNVMEMRCRGSQNMTVAITGANGFVGARVAQMLTAGGMGTKLRLLSRRATRQPGAIVADMLDPRSVRAALEGCHAVIHCAFDFQDMAANFDIAKTLATECVAIGARLVHISTAAVHEPFPDGEMDESHVPVPAGSDYKKVKLHIEQMLLRRGRDSGLDLVILQPTVIYGAHGRAWTDSPIRELLTGTVVLPMEGNGLCNPVYIDDVCDAVIAALTAPDASGERFLINGPGPVTWAEFYTAYRDMLGFGTIKSQPASVISPLEHFDATPDTLSRGRSVKARVMRMFGARLIGRMQILASFARSLVAGETVHIPTGAKLALFQARCVVRTDKAERLLGYVPRFDLLRGMEMTAPYVQRGYGRLARLKAAYTRAN